MPEERKTVINRLQIVWQGQSWSVIAPDGEVLGRFKNKKHAIGFAEKTFDYTNDPTESKRSSFATFQGEEFPFDLPIPETVNSAKEAPKSKSEKLIQDSRFQAWRKTLPRVDRKFVLLAIVGIVSVVLVGTLLIIVVSAVFPVARDIFVSITSHLLFKLALVGLILTIVISALSETINDHDLLGCSVRLFILFGFVALLDAVGILPAFLTWLF